MATGEEIDIDAARRRYVIGLDAAGDDGLSEEEFKELVTRTGYRRGWSGTLSGLGRNGLTARRNGRYYRTPISSLWAALYRGEDEYGWGGPDLVELIACVERYAGIGGLLWQRRNVT